MSHGRVRRLARALVAGALGCATLAATPVLALPKARPEEVGFNPERLKKLDDHMQTMVDHGQIAGAVTLLARHGRVVHAKAFGRRALGGEAMPLNAIFRIRSETKPVTGVAMMILYEQGLWKLDDPISKYVPEFADLRIATGVDASGQPILAPLSRPPTMRELMTHTAGFAYGLADDPNSPADQAYYRAGVLQSASLSDLVQKVSELPMYSEPGQLWRYSVAADIQGYIVEKLSGQTLPVFMEEHIFTPLKMVDTGFWLPPEKTDRLASLYVWGPKVKKLVPAEGFMVLDISKPPAMASGGGGLVSTNADYARFAQMLLNGGELDGKRILKPETVKLMRTNMLSDTIMNSDVPPFNTAKGRGFGLDFSVVLDSAKAGPQGNGTYSWGGAAGTWFWIDPTNDLFFLGMIHILNKDGDPAIAHIDQDSAKLVYDALKDPSK